MVETVALARVDSSRKLHESRAWICNVHRDVDLENLHRRIEAEAQLTWARAGGACGNLEEPPSHHATNQAGFAEVVVTQPRERLDPRIEIRLRAKYGGPSTRWLRAIEEARSKADTDRQRYGCDR